MDLNALPKQAPVPLRVMRLTKPVETIDPDLEVFDGGEAIEAAAPAEADELADAFQAWLAEQEAVEQAMPLHSGPDAMEQAIADLRAQVEAEQALFRRKKLELEAELAAEEETRWHVRACPLPECGTGVRVERADDDGDVLGLGMSMSAALELEQMLLGHLKSHALGEWVHAITTLRRDLNDALETNTQMAPAPAPRPEPGEFILQGEPRPALPGLPTGSFTRSPERQAAVDALDARLGGQRPAPVDSVSRDQSLRARREARRAKQPSPYDLTPKYKPDMGDGVVGIKR